MHAKPDFPVHPLRISVSPTDLHVCFVGGWWNLVVGLKTAALAGFLFFGSCCTIPVAGSFPPQEGKSTHPPTNTQHAHAPSHSPMLLASPTHRLHTHTHSDIHSEIQRYIQYLLSLSHTHPHRERYIRKYRHRHAIRMHILCPRDESIDGKRSTLPVRLAISPKLGGKTWLLILRPPSLSVSLSSSQKPYLSSLGA